MSTYTPLPVVYPLEVWPDPSRPGRVLLSVECPHCGRTHVHVGDADHWTGVRSADCTPVGYLVAEWRAEA